MRGSFMLLAAALIAEAAFVQPIDRTAPAQGPKTEKGEVATPGGQAQPSMEANATGHRANGPGSAGTSSSPTHRRGDLSSTKNAPAPENGIYSGSAPSSGTSGKNNK